MRILEGTKVVEATPERAEALMQGRPIVVDVGAGDGRFVYEAARGDAKTLYVGLDPDAAALAAYAYRASRKPSRGGVENVLYVVVALEQLPAELVGVAALAHVNFPWSALLRGVIRPERELLTALGRLLRPRGRLEIVLCYDAEHDKAALGGEALPPLGEAYIEEVLRPAYEEAALTIVESGRLDREAALAIPSTWGRRLLHGRPRDVFRIAAVGAEVAAAAPDRIG